MHVTVIDNTPLLRVPTRWWCPYCLNGRLVNYHYPKCHPSCSNDILRQPGQMSYHCAPYQSDPTYLNSNDASSKTKLVFFREGSSHISVINSFIDSHTKRKQWAWTNGSSQQHRNRKKSMTEQVVYNTSLLKPLQCKACEVFPVDKDKLAPIVL